MGAWLVKEFTFLGIHFQNWMLVYAVILFGAALMIWWERRS
jgi:hypothetical protein